MKIDLTKDELVEIIYSFSCVDPSDCDDLHYLVLEKIKKLSEENENRSY
jgi:hypothetical protein